MIEGKIELLSVCRGWLEEIGYKTPIRGRINEKDYFEVEGHIERMAGQTH